MDSVALKQEEWKPQSIRKEHEALTHQYLNDGFNDTEASAKAWDELLERTLQEMRR